MRMIECESLTKKYGKTQVLQDITFSIDGVGCIGFLGANGAGKTTTIRILTGLAEPTSGVVKVAGYDVVKERNKVTRMIGYCPQIPSFYDFMTGEEWMHWAGSIYRLDKATLRKRTEELLHLCGIYDAKDRAVGGYSGGMKQRLAIAQALIHEPKIIILDEPVSALDPMGRYDVLQLIEKLKKDMTVFMSTHILDDIERVADHIVIIRKGTVLLSSSIDQLRKDHMKPIIEFTLEKSTIELESVFKNTPWINEVTVEGDSYTLHTNDIEVAKKELPQMIVASGAILSSYEVSALTLEDVFLKVVNES